MKSFQITIRSQDSTTRYSALARSSAEAFAAAAARAGDKPCGITVTPFRGAQ